MDEKKNGRRMLDMEELGKVAGGEERRKDFDHRGGPGNQGTPRNQGGLGAVEQASTPIDPLTPEQIQVMLNAAMENMNPIKGPVKR